MHFKVFFFLPVTIFNQSSLVQIMRETLIYLSHLDHEDTEKQVKYLMPVVLFMFLGIIINQADIIGPQQTSPPAHKKNKENPSKYVIVVD